MTDGRPRVHRPPIAKGGWAADDDRRAQAREGREGKKFHRIERAYGTFVRLFALPMDADETRITAEHNEGLLLLHLEKLNKPLPKTIEVKVS